LSIILLHGAIGAADQLEPLKTILQEEGRDAYTFSFSGHGKTPFNKKGFGIDVFAEELETFIKKHDLIQPHVFGYSMGGYVALYLASQKPNALRSIHTLGTKFDWNEETAAKEAAMLDPRTIEEKVPKFAAALKHRHGEEQWESLLSKTAEMMKSLAEENLLNEEVLKAIENKTLIGLADKDTMVSYEETRTVYTQLPEAAMYMLPGSKHPIEQVDTQLLAKIILHHAV
jgi:pimeloyl-ACP methyl ester carboxylesterase